MDLHRKLALKEKTNDIFKVKEGLIPRYAGIVNKFAKNYL